MLTVSRPLTSPNEPATVPDPVGAPRFIPGLTIARGVLALWVVIYHFWNDVLVLFPWATPASPVARNGHYAVPGFFMLSGLVLMHTHARQMRTFDLRTALAFLRLRLIRIYPVHLVTLLCVLAMVAVSMVLHLGHTATGYSASDFVLNLVLAQTWVPRFSLNWNYPSWSISSEWFAYCLFPSLVPVVLRYVRSRAASIGLMALTLGGTVAMMVLWVGRPFYELLLVVPTFIAGVAIFTFAAASKPLLWSVARLVLPVAAGMVITGGFIDSEAAKCTVLIIGLHATLLAIYMTAPRPPGGGVLHAGLQRLGDVSYSLYMTHTLAQKVLYVGLPVARFARAPLVVRAGVALGYVAVITMACLACHRAVERPSYEALRRHRGRATG